MTVVSISGTRHNPRKKLPRAADLATLLRAGDTCDGIAATHRCSARTVAQRLNEAGYNAVTGVKWEDEPKPAASVVLGIPFDAQPWADQAICASTDPELFFPDRGQNPWTAKAICAGCPVRNLCLDYALRNGEAFGVWGGLSERERRQVKQHETVARTDARTCALDGCDGTITGRPNRRYCSDKCKAAVEYQRRLQRQQEAS